MSTPAEGAAHARQILDTLHEYETDAVDFRVQLAIAEALTAIAQVVTYTPRAIISPEQHAYAEAAVGLLDALHSRPQT